MAFLLGPEPKPQALAHCLYTKYYTFGNQTPKAEFYLNIFFCEF